MNAPPKKRAAPQRTEGRHAHDKVNAINFDPRFKTLISVCKITAGHIKGRVLVCRESLDAFIESYVGTPPHDAAINRNRTEAATSGTAQ